jgi:hypothetical protein
VIGGGPGAGPTELPPLMLGIFSVGAGAGAVGGGGVVTVVVVVVVVVVAGLLLALFPQAAVSAPVPAIMTAPATMPRRRANRPDPIDPIPICPPVNRVPISWTLQRHRALRDQLQQVLGAPLIHEPNSRQGEL